MDLIDRIRQERQIAQDAGFATPKRKRQSSLKLGAKHAVRTEATRAVTKAFGNTLLGSIFALIVRRGINKALK